MIYNTYSHIFVRGVLEQDGVVAAADAAPMISGATDGVLGITAPRVHTDLRVYQRVLEAVG